LGLTEEEFWQSTLAKVTALYRIQVLQWDQTRDYFVCELVSLTLNKLRTKEDQHIWTTEELLSRRYPKFKSQTVTVTPKHDPDFGAAGGTELKTALKGITEKRKKSAARRAKNARRT
jgi:hypothetical protein